MVPGGSFVVGVAMWNDQDGGPFTISVCPYLVVSLNFCQRQQTNLLLQLAKQGQT